MSLELIIKVLIDLGLSRVDAELYVYLAKKGPQKMVDLVKALTYKKAKIYSSLRNLQTKKLVSKNPPMFCALPFEEALELLIKSKKEQTEVMIEYKKELLVREKNEKQDSYFTGKLMCESTPPSTFVSENAKWNGYSDER